MSKRLFSANLMKSKFTILLLMPIVLIFNITACATPEVVNPYDNKPIKQEITVYNFASCVKAGNKITRSYPPQCITNEGEIYVNQEIARGPDLKTKMNCKDLCGDGSCQEMVCMGLGCPCAETKSSCPSDCK